MKPFNKEICNLYIQTAPIWELSASSPGETLGESVVLAWKEAFSEELDLANLPEPYNMHSENEPDGDELYVFPNGRYLYICHADPKDRRIRAGAEIREKQPFYFLNSVSGENERVITSFYARDDASAKMKMIEFLPKNLSWRLYKRFQPGSEAELVFTGN